MALETVYGKRKIDDIVDWYRHGKINLKPGFQRKSVWSISDRRRLIQSIVSKYPLPNIFLYRRSSRGKTIYDVIDGKQRLETILMFMGIKEFKNECFDVKLELDEDGLCLWNWADIRKHAKGTRESFKDFELQTAEVSGELSEIVDLFVSINSTGKRLTSGERRHARFFDSPFLKEAEKLVRSHRQYVLDQRILSRGQLTRMKGTELFSELLISIHKERLINKKAALDSAISNESINGNTLKRIVREFTRTINLVKKMFPEIRQTRFRNSVEFYSLFMLVWDMDNKKLVLNDKRSNKMAFEIIRKLSTGIDELRDQQRRAKASKPRSPYSDYLPTVLADTDSSATRERRDKILRGLLMPIFERKDSKRTFSLEQRRILWNSDTKHKCAKCHRNLTWDDFTVDHVVAYVRGGKTELTNAQLMCRSCNSRKGSR